MTDNLIVNLEHAHSRYRITPEPGMFGSMDRLTQAVSKAGHVPSKPGDFAYLHVMAYRAAKEGFKYLVLDKSRTHTGRDEMVPLSVKAIAKGQKLISENYVPLVRDMTIRAGMICLGDVRMPGKPAPAPANQIPIEEIPNLVIPVFPTTPVTPTALDQDGEALLALCIDVIDRLSQDTRKKIAKLMLGL